MHKDLHEGKTDILNKFFNDKLYEWYTDLEIGVNVKTC
jgi:hypothetical protein